MIEFNPEFHYLGTLCKRGHDYEGTGLSVRRIRGRMCAECNRSLAKAYYEANKDEQRAHRKAYYEANKDEKMAYSKAYREANKDKKRAYREANKDKIKAQIKAYREANKDKIKAQAKAYYEINKEEIADEYAKGLIRQNISIKTSKITPKMIDLKREQITLHRLIKEIKNGLTGTRD